MGVADEALAAAADARRFTWLETATVVQVLSVGDIVVNQGGNQLRIPTLVRVQVNDLVRILRSAESTPVCIGSTTSRPVLGTLSSFISGVSVTILGLDGVTYASLPYVTTYAPTIGHLVAVSWTDQGGLVLGQVSSQAGTGDPSVVPPPPPKPTEGTEYFSANDSASFRGSGGPWTNKVYYSENQIGIWVYGTKIRDTLAGATALPGCSIYLPTEHASGSNARLGIHGASSVPGTAPSVGSERPVSVSVDGPGWFPLDTDLAQYVINNNGAGIGTIGPGYRIFTGTQGNNDSGRLAINYRR